MDQCSAQVATYIQSLSTQPSSPKAVASWCHPGLHGKDADLSQHQQGSSDQRKFQLSPLLVEIPVT